MTAPDEEHSITTAWLADAVDFIRTAQAYGRLTSTRVPCRCGGTLVVQFTGDPIQDSDAILDAFGRPHAHGAHEPDVDPHDIAPHVALDVYEVERRHLRVVREGE